LRCVMDFSVPAIIPAPSLPGAPVDNSPKRLPDQVGPFSTSACRTREVSHSRRAPLARTAVAVRSTSPSSRLGASGWWVPHHPQVQAATTCEINTSGFHQAVGLTQSTGSCRCFPTGPNNRPLPPRTFQSAPIGPAAPGVPRKPSFRSIKKYLSERVPERRSEVGLAWNTRLAPG
jgi:hypothetical protein